MPFLFLPLISAIFMQSIVAHTSHNTLITPIRPITTNTTTTKTTTTIKPDQFFELNPAKIDLLFRRTALMALLRAKANAIIGTVPLVERVLFKQCLTESDTISPVKLAKCLTKMIQSSKDQQQQQQQQHDSNKRKEWAQEKNQGPATAAAVEQQMRQKDILQNSLGKNGRKLSRIRHFFAVWRRREGQRRRGEMEMMGKQQRMRRQKRKVISQKPISGDQTLLNVSLRHLHELERYMQILDKARRAIARINAQNTELMSRFDPFVNVRSTMPDGPPALHDLQQQIAHFFDALGIDQIALLSPRFFSLFPPSQRHRNRPKLLSPDLFSFRNNNDNSDSSSSLLSIPNMLSSAHLGERESAAWLELLLNITGSAKIMEHLVVKLKPDVQRVERDILPAIVRMEQAENRWQHLRNSLSDTQRRMLDMKGYTPLAVQQRHILFSDIAAAGCSSESEFVCSSPSAEETAAEAEREFEQNIAELARMEEENNQAALDHKLDMFITDQDRSQQQRRAFRQEMRRRRKKRQDVGGLAPDTEEGGRTIPRTVVLEPFAFDTRLGGVVLEGIYLSPTAFYRELASPEVLTIRALSPIAFYATILSPMVAFARILSPEVFKAQILTPQVLDAFVLSPEAFMAEVLSPLAAEARVLAPRTLFVQILGPTAGALHIGSPDTHGVLVLSPHILSPRIYSEERYLIEGLIFSVLCRSEKSINVGEAKKVLSPHFLGGEHEQDTEEDTHVHLGGTVRFVGWPGHSPLGEESEHKHEHEHGHEQKKVAAMGRKA